MTPLLHMPLTSGFYLVLAQVRVLNAYNFPLQDSDRDVGCGLRWDNLGGSIIQAPSTSWIRVPGNGSASLTLQFLYRPAATTNGISTGVDVVCIVDGFAPASMVSAIATLDAVEVSSATVTTIP